ncbi:MAG: hypothetical protein JSW72_00065, partial [Candidatus Bathyarchaeota archaeon]
SQILDEINRMGSDQKEKLRSVGILNETAVIKGAEAFLTRELNSEIRVHTEDDPQRHDPKSRAQMAKPYRPAIYIE